MCIHGDVLWFATAICRAQHCLQLCFLGSRRSWVFYFKNYQVLMVSSLPHLDAVFSKLTLMTNYWKLQCIFFWFYAVSFHHFTYHPTVAIGKVVPGNPSTPLWNWLLLRHNLSMLYYEISNYCFDIKSKIFSFNDQVLVWIFFFFWDVACLHCPCCSETNWNSLSSISR
jgi:hypothetical protein